MPAEKGSKRYTANSIKAALQDAGWRPQVSVWADKHEGAGTFTWYNYGANFLILHEQDGAGILLKEVGGARAMSNAILEHKRKAAKAKQEKLSGENVLADVFPMIEAAPESPEL